MYQKEFAPVVERQPTHDAIVLAVAVLDHSAGCSFIPLPYWACFGVPTSGLFPAASAARIILAVARYLYSFRPKASLTDARGVDQSAAGRHAG